MQARFHKLFEKLKSFLKTKKGKLGLVLLVFLTWFWFSLPSPLFRDSQSTVLLDKDANLLGAKIASDGQWRFPYDENVPDKFAKALVQFEDRSFYYHPGVNLQSLARAFWQNIKGGRRISGGSTITMQVMRLARKNRSRSYWNKLIETILAARLEVSYSKKQILALYASNAPFGSNVVGLDAASWRYFGRKPQTLSWAEAATLAILPNAPSLIYPGKNQEKLFAKRNRLLDRLYEHGDMDKETCELAKQEPLPQKPFPLPQSAPHLLERASAEGMKGQFIQSTVDENIQLRVNEIVNRNGKKLELNQIHNACALVLDVESGNVLAYVGNTDNHTNDSTGKKSRSAKDENGNDVDVITAPRSTGSIMKPFLYASMLNDGEILPNMLVADIPTQMGDFSPKNYSLTYDGAVPAKRALARSLNVPIVRLLLNYGMEKFHYKLNRLGLTTVKKPASHYGLSIILGGAEARLWELCGIYASMARTLNHYTKYNGKYTENDFHPANYLASGKKQTTDPGKVLSASSIFLAFEAMSEVNRPDEDASWKQYLSSYKVAWKTGTSFGFRDGWAIGVTPKYVVGVWAGNAGGEGRPGLTGITTAAPILFEIFSALRPSTWFTPPFDEMKKVALCRQSGYRATDICEEKDSVWIPEAGLKTPPCPYHRIVHLTADGKWRVNSDCEKPENMVHKPWFVLPPAQEYYYKSKNASYKELPPFRKDCEPTGTIAMELIYPRQVTKIYVPVELDGTMGKTVFQVAHRRSDAVIYWHIDDKYIGQTKGIHQLGCAPEAGPHVLTLVDDAGETLSQKFEIIGKEKEK